MNRQSSMIVAALAALALFPACAFANSAPVPKRVAVAAAGEAVAYAALEHRIGDEIVIETTLNTMRRGVLVKYTNPTLTIQLGPDHGSIQLSVPQDSIRSIRVVKRAAPVAAGAQQETR